MSSGIRPGLYVHVPFCRSKCLYCDFYSVTTRALVHPWLEAIRKEAALYRGDFGVFDSLYLGGGTPSLLDVTDLALLLESLSRNLDFALDTEITIEVNPDDATDEKLKAFRELGINRISLGVQSFHDAELAWLGRKHSAMQGERALETICAAGFRNVGVDLIYGFHAQTESRWLETLEKALRFSPAHLSCYMLSIEKGTPLGAMKHKGMVMTVGEARQSRLFLLTSRCLEDHGYLHYEVSNFSKGECRAARHNQKYWTHVPYLGLGPAAHSLLHGVRWWNERSISRYCTRIAKNQKPVAGSETLTPEQLELERLYLGLRTRFGVEAGLIRKNASCAKALNRLCRKGYLETRGNRIIPTIRGFLVSDRLPLELLG